MHSSTLPLLQHAGQEDAQMQDADILQCPVTCNGVQGTLSIAGDGSVEYQPQQAGRSVCCCGACCHTQHREQQIPGWHVVGAALESPSSFRVWYFTASGGDNSSPATSVSPKFRLCKSLPFVCGSGSEASACMQRVRRGAAWRGRDAAPRVVAVINPKSGQGRAVKVFQQQVVPVLEDAAGMSVTSLVTQHAGHATQLVAQLNLAAIDLIVFVGGDGTVYEGLQGLLGRPDWDKARLVPLAHIPAGSGNGLAHSCGLRDAPSAAFAIAKGVTSPMDVASVLQPPGSRRYLMLSVAYGTLANLDVNTEPLRWLGELRFTLGALWEVWKGDFYTAGIAWLPPEDEVEAAAAAAAAAAAGSAATSPAPSPANGHSTGSSGGGGGAHRHDPMRTSQESSSSSSSPPKQQQQQQQGPGALPVSDAHVASVSAAAANAAAAHPPGPFVTLASFPTQGPELPLLQRLGRLPLAVPPAPSARAVLGPGWRVWHDPLPLFACVNPPYIAATSKLNPWGRLHQGYFNMLWLDVQPGLWGRCQAVDMLTKAETGRHADSPYMVQHKVRAMVFEPRDTNTYMQLDGEVIPNAPIFMEVHPGLIRVILSPAHPEEPAADHSRPHFSRAAAAHGSATRAGAAGSDQHSK